MQGPLRGRKWVIGASLHRCWLGCYETEISSFLQTKLKRGSTFFDIGSETGYYALLGSVLVGTEGRVVAFEPNPRNIAYVKRHISLNHLDNVKLVEAAVADREGTCSFAKGANAQSGHLASKGDITVRTVSLDEEIARSTIPVPDAIKIDVAGAELKVFQGARNLLLRNGPAIIIEIHPWIPEFADASAQSCEFLKDCGYELEAITGRGLDDTCHIYASPGSRRPA
jgi:FkbM family methyltransferase